MNAPSVAWIERKLIPLIERAAGFGEKPECEVTLEPPRNAAHGDLAASVAMQLASRRRRPPLELARALAESLEPLIRDSSLSAHIERVEVKPPGFVNFFFSRDYLRAVLKEVLASGAAYGRDSCVPARRIHLEFVSANPTGPLSVAHGRQAALGDAVANLLEFAGDRVTREYYLNDEGTQIDLLGASLLARARQAAGLSGDFPEGGYKGAYVAEAAACWPLAQKGARALEAIDAPGKAKAFAVEQMLERIRRDLDRFGVRFDRWYRQSGLKRFGYLNRSLDLLKRRGFLYERQRAWWLRSTAFGDDKDRVVIRSDGRMTYIASDIAYHRRKFSKGYTQVVNFWGPDHHGYIPRLKAAVEALGFDPNRLSIRIVQLCTLKRGGKAVPMSTREGEFTTLGEVIDEVGRDAARFFFLLRKADQHLEFDLELAKRQSLENPVYYIQYAHARIASLRARLQAEGQEPPPPTDADLQALEAPEELDLLRALREFPAVVRSCADSLEPFGLVVCLQGLAERFHRFYDRHRVMGAERSRAAARLALARAVQTVLASGLKILGVSAPAKM